jgi:hydrogenase expression/formation protein HypE
MTADLKDARILLDHGSGGAMSHRLITEMMLPAFDNDVLAQLDDGALVEMEGTRLAFSTDTYVVDPIFFPGGSIGDLAVNGTVNDLAMCGAVPRYLSAGMIIEEGFDRRDLKKILADMARAARRAGVAVVTGDTKVVPRGAADKIFINTSGIGVVPPGVQVSGDRARPGDVVILSGSIADHGVTILVQREGLEFESDVCSDSAPLNHLVACMFDAAGGIHVLRDPTRGGVATTLNEIAAQSGVGILIREDRIPVEAPVGGICELLGVDPLYVANEGKLLALVDPADADAVLAVMRQDPLGKGAVIIGEVSAQHAGRVVLQTRIGGTRIVGMLTGEQLPRIC